VAAVGLLYLTVRRWFSASAALLAGAVFALTPVAVLMFRFNNPDAFLVLLLVGSAYATVRALERGATSWLLLAFSLIGFAFLAKMLQAFVVVPVFGLVYLVAAPVVFRRRIGQLVLAGLAMVASAGWWVAVVELTPASARPYVGGSQNNSILDLVFGYNGFGRLTGNETGSVGGGAQATGRWGPTGWTRMFGAEFGTQISWLLPAALILLGAGLVWRGRAPRTDRARAAFLLWGGWLVVTGAVFSFGQGIIHPYYSVALAPAVGALVGMGVATLWARRREPAARGVLAIALVATGVWGFVLLGRTADWTPWLRGVVLVGALVGAGALVAVHRLSGRVAAFVAVGAITVAVVAPAAYSLSTVRTAHAGAIPSAGPRGASAFGGPGGGPGGGARPGGAGGFAGPPAGGTAPGGGFAGPPPGGATGGLLNGSTPSAALTKLLGAQATRFTWVAATVGANEAAGYQLATDDPVMAIGGFNGTDPSPTLARFQADVRGGRIHYFIAGGRMFGGGSSGSSAAITAWVTANFSSQTVGGVTVYDLTRVGA
jgi:4-amino-4-deoxy-L-arabinose transferase-like glycosyltransferase